MIMMEWAARGMHLHFMCLAWQEDPPCSLTDNNAALRKMVGSPRRWRELKKQIFRAWQHEGRRWVQLGLLREFQKQQKYSESRKANALKRFPVKDPEAHDEHMDWETGALHLQSSTTNKRDNIYINNNYKTKEEYRPHDIAVEEYWRKRGARGPFKKKETNQ